MRVVALILFSIAVACSDVAGAQNDDGGRDRAADQERPEEIVVRGKRLADFRVEVEKARVRAYAIFNEINSTDDFDISCNSEKRTGTRLGQQVCAPRFEGRISSRAGRDYLAAMRWVCNGEGGLTQDCLFSQLSGHGIAAARAAESEAPTQRDRLTEEIDRLARTDLRFGQAILDFYDASVKYEEERNRSRERTDDR